MSALRNIASPQSAKILAKIALNPDERFTIRGVATQGLVNTGTGEAANGLLEIHKNQNSEQFKLKIIKALGDAGIGRALADLLGLLKEEQGRKAQWRKIRDQNTESYINEQRNECIGRLEKVQP